MGADVSKLQFYSGYPIDKIVQEDQITIIVPMGTPQTQPPYPSLMQKEPNNFGQKALVKASWSIDGSNFNSSLTTLNYYSNTFMEPINKASVNCGVDSQFIYFYAINNFTTDLIFTINYAVYSIT